MNFDALLSKIIGNSFWDLHMLGNIVLENLELRKKNCPIIKSQSTYFVLM